MLLFFLVRTASSLAGDGLNINRTLQFYIFRFNLKPHDDTQFVQSTGSKSIYIVEDNAMDFVLYL